jgi:hypothetical protein
MMHASPEVPVRAIRLSAPFTLALGAALTAASCSAPAPTAPAPAAPPFSVVEASIPDMQAALRDGRLALLPADPQVLAFTREHEQQSLLCVFNISSSAARLTLPADWHGATLLDGSGLTGARVDGDSVQCDPFGGLFLQRP